MPGTPETPLSRDAAEPGYSGAADAALRRRGDFTTMKLPKHLHDALTAIVNQSGDDIGFVLGYLSRETASSYVSKLKRRGLAYTHHSGSTIEVWPHPKGRALIATDSACAVRPGRA